MKTMQPNWMHINPQPKIAHDLLGPVHSARGHLSSWSEEEAEECWHDLEGIINAYLITFPQYSHVFILANDLLQYFEPFNNFIKKWGVRKLNISNLIVISIQLLSLYILYHAEKENVTTVLDANHALISKTTYEETFSNPPKEICSKIQSIRAKKMRRDNLSFVIEKILSTNPKAKHEDVVIQITHLENCYFEIPTLGKSIIIKKIHSTKGIFIDGEIEWLNKKGKIQLTKISSLFSRITRIRKWLNNYR